MRLPTLWAILAITTIARAAAAQAGDDVDVEVPRASPPEAPSPSQAPPKAANPAVPSAGVTAAPASGTPPTAAADTEIQGLRRELEDTRARLDALEARPVAPPPGSGPRPGFVERFAPRDYSVSAYIQSQYENHQDSQDQVEQGNVDLNQDRFLVRRGRVEFDAAWRFAELALQLDGNTTHGTSFGLRRAEASLVWRGSSWSGKVQRSGVREDVAPPPIKLTFGLTDIPFGFEQVDRARDRVFMERTQGSLAFFPGDPDVGVSLSGALGVLRYSLAVMNGVPIDDRPGAGQDPSSSKDIIARIGADGHVTRSLRIAGGLSILRGEGFHAGTDATKNTLQWNDANENSVVDTGEVVAVPGSAATPSATFSRWGYNLDLRARLLTPIGETMVYGEVTIGQNLDRGLVIADPVATGIDTREIAYYAAIVQDITPYALVGFRYDLYNPNADFFDKRSGKLLPTSQSLHTLSPLVGLVLPPHARLVFQYDIVRDLLGRDDRGVPVDLKNNRWTLRLQVQL